jgi:hypothetical protein
VLGVAPVENPEELLQLSALDWGSLVHEALERFILEVLARDAPPSPDEPWSDADRARMAEIGRELCAEYEARGITGRPVFWRRNQVQIQRDLRRFLDADDINRREKRTRPVAVEFGFGGSRSTLGAVPMPLPDGRTLHFRGQADRVDVDEAGGLHVVDYKTGSDRDYTALSEENPDERGRRVQLPVYGVAARLHQQQPDACVLAEYWFVSYKGNFKRIGYEITDDVLARVGATLGLMVEGIEGGVFAAHPTQVSSAPFVECTSCDPDALGVTELRAAWERKRQDPRLAKYAELAEPLEVDLVEDDEQELPSA